jgi:hypothetical protein
MEVRPVPVGGAGRPAGPRTRLLIVLPALVLVGVVGLAVLGGDGRVAGTGPDGSPDDRAAAASGRPAARALPTESRRTPAPGEATVTPRPSPVRLPGHIVGMRIDGIATARREALERPDPDRLVAVAGRLTIAPGDPRCETNWYLACPRSGRLMATGDNADADPDALVVRTQPGVPLIGLQRQSPQLGTWTVPNGAVVVGRFGTDAERECSLPRRDCAPVFTVERLVWLRSTFRARPVANGPGAIQAETPIEAAEASARAGLPGAGATLLIGVLDRSSLDLLDPAAAAAVSDHPADAVVWYLRAIVWPDGEGVGDPRVGWSLVDDRTGQLLATAPPPIASGTVGTRH